MNASASGSPTGRYPSAEALLVEAMEATGLEATVGLSGFGLELQSLEALLAGGVALGTPPDAGAVVRTGHRFTFEPEPPDEWLEWAPMDNEYDRFYVGDKVFCARAGKKKFRNNLVRTFPDEEQAIDRYLALLKKAGKGATAFGLERILPAWQRVLMWPWLRLQKPAWLYHKTYDVLSELTDNQDLIATLCGQWGDMGLPPKRSPFFMPSSSQLPFTVTMATPYWLVVMLA